MSHQPRPRGEGKWEVRLHLANVNWFTNKRAELASCSQMRINLSLSLSQSTPAKLLFLTAHIYRACIPTIYRWWKNEEHSQKQTMIFNRHRFSLSSDGRWHSSYYDILLEGSEPFRIISAACAEHGLILILLNRSKSSTTESSASIFYFLKFKGTRKTKENSFIKVSGSRSR